MALATGMSRRRADAVVNEGKVKINNVVAQPGQVVQGNDRVLLDGKELSVPENTSTVLFNKPVGYVVSRDGQGSKTVYDLLPAELHSLKPIGRLDKYSSGLLLLTNNGKLAQELTHPSFQKQKIYELELDKILTDPDKAKIESGIELEDGPSSLKLDGESKNWTATMSEGRNRQIRRTFATLGYRVLKLHRIQFGPYALDDLPSGKFTAVKI